MQGKAAQVLRADSSRLRLVIKQNQSDASADDFRAGLHAKPARTRRPDAMECGHALSRGSPCQSVHYQLITALIPLPEAGQILGFAVQAEVTIVILREDISDAQPNLPHKIDRCHHSSNKLCCQISFQLAFWGPRLAATPPHVSLKISNSTMICSEECEVPLSFILQLLEPTPSDLRAIDACFAR